MTIPIVPVLTPGGATPTIPHLGPAILATGAYQVGSNWRSNLDNAEWLETSIAIPLADWMISWLQSNNGQIELPLVHAPPYSGHGNNRNNSNPHIVYMITGLNIVTGKPEVLKFGIGDAVRNKYRMKRHLRRGIGLRLARLPQVTGDQRLN